VSQHSSILLIIDAADNLSAAIRQVEVFKDRRPTGRIAILADHDQPNDIASAFRAGANAYFIKVAPCDALIKYLELVMLGETILPAAILSTVVDRTDDPQGDRAGADSVYDVSKAMEESLETSDDDMPRLSDRERCILNCLIAGDSNKTIARKIEIAEATVKVHVKAILRKVRVQNRTQAAIWAMSNGLSISTIGHGSHAPAAAEATPPVAADHALSARRRNAYEACRDVERAVPKLAAPRGR
jgi:two-component system nitrate/nitrite response regulator NarL